MTRKQIEQNAKLAQLISKYNLDDEAVQGLVDTYGENIDLMCETVESLMKVINSVK